MIKMRHCIDFTIIAQRHKDGQFSIPNNVCNELNLEYGAERKLHLLILDAKTNQVLTEIDKELKSGNEIYGPELTPRIKAGTQLRIIASKL